MESGVINHSYYLLINAKSYDIIQHALILSSVLQLHVFKVEAFQELLCTLNLFFQTTVSSAFFTQELF